MEWTAQNYYDRLVEDAYNGNFPCMSESGPQYKMIKNGKEIGCAAGILLPEGGYKRSMEALSVKELPDDTFLIPKGMTRNDVASCQQKHDQYFWDIYNNGEEWNPANFVKCLNELACFEHIVKKEV